MITDSKLPNFVEKLFWDTEANSLDLATHKNFIIERILSAGGWESLCWLRQNFSDQFLRDWFYKGEGRNLSPKQLKYWELVLNLDSNKVDEWLSKARGNPFFQR